MAYGYWKRDRAGLDARKRIAEAKAEPSVPSLGTESAPTIGAHAALAVRNGMAMALPGYRGTYRRVSAGPHSTTHNYKGTVQRKGYRAGTKFR